MSWAAGRRTIIVGIIGASILAFLIVLSATIFSKAPSCSDEIQNQGEAGIDCGGPCQYLCTATEQPATVLFTKAIVTSEGRVDIVASIENKNAVSAAKQVPYAVTLYGTDTAVIQKVTGTVDLPPATTVYVYVPRVATASKNSVVRAFLTIDPSAPHWFSMGQDSRVKPFVSNTTFRGTLAAPRIDATLTNPSATTLSDVSALVLVYDANHEVMAASQTIVPQVPPQGDATATFTWNEAFAHTPATIEVVPIIPLP